MNYTELVKKSAALLRAVGVQKLVTDIASLLDNPIFGYPKAEGTDNYAIMAMAKIREEMYHILCAAFVETRMMEIPPPEPEFYNSILNNEVREDDQVEAKRISSFAAKQVHEILDTESASIYVSLIAMFQIFPQCCGYSSISKEKLVAKLNQLLIANGADPIRPDYTKMEKNLATTMKAPSRSIRIVIVDDDIADLAKTLKRLAGWKRVELVPYRHHRSSYGSTSKVPKSDRLVEMAEKIIATQPDIILMDQGLDNDIEGSDLIPAIQALSPDILVVANTGGEDTKQRRVGAYPNCNKGEKLDSIARAIEDLPLKKVENMAVAAS